MAPLSTPNETQAPQTNNLISRPAHCISPWSISEHSQKAGGTTHQTRDPQWQESWTTTRLSAPHSATLKGTKIKDALYGTRGRGAAVPLTHYKSTLHWSTLLSWTVTSWTPLGTTESDNLSNNHKQAISCPSNRHLTKKDPPTNMAISRSDQLTKDQLNLRDQENQPIGPLRPSYGGRHPPLNRYIWSPNARGAPKPSTHLNNGDPRTGPNHYQWPVIKCQLSIFTIEQLIMRELQHVDADITRPQFHRPISPTQIILLSPPCNMKGPSAVIPLKVTP